MIMHCNKKDRLRSEDAGYRSYSGSSGSGLLSMFCSNLQNVKEEPCNSIGVFSLHVEIVHQSRNSDLQLKRAKPTWIFPFYFFFQMLKIRQL